MRVRGLKQSHLDSYNWCYLLSHPVRVRGLKLELEVNHGIVKTSHPVRVRGLKPINISHGEERIGRTPCGCVG